MRRRDFLGAACGLPSLKLSEPRPACIVLRMTGGASHLDTFDMKPEVPREIRGPFRPIGTNVAGMEISEIFPRMARMADKFAIVRSVHHAATTHAGAARLFDFKDDDGIRVVNMFPNVFDGASWDVHGWKPFGTIESCANVAGPMFDRAFTSLLEQVGESTVVVGLGEFGRAPKINPDGGRDHWPHCFSVVMGGGGIRGGQVYGSSDAMGAEPADNPVTPAMLTATIRKAIRAPAWQARTKDLAIEDLLLSA
jgi:uncharacterized protein (DUF1501 family)